MTTNIITAIQATKTRTFRNMQDVRNKLRQMLDGYKTDLAKVKAAGRERQLAIETNYMAKCLLGSYGIPLEMWEYEDYSKEANVSLENSRDLTKVRQALGVPIKVTKRKQLVEKSRKKMWVYCTAEGYPGLTIRYKTTIKENGPCKVVRSKRSYYSRSLVCEV